MILRQYCSLKQGGSREYDKLPPYRRDRDSRRACETAMTALGIRSIAP